MQAKEAIGEIFYTAFKALDKKQKELLLMHMLEDPEFKEDLIDLVLIEQAKQEAGKPILAKEYFARRKDSAI